MVKTVESKKEPITLETIEKEYPEVFSGRIGKFKGDAVELMIDKTIKPVIQKPRRTPINLTKPAAGKVGKLVKEDIIERYPDKEPRTWVSPSVIVSKPNGDVRLCVDMRLANKAI